ncbi:helix-turn-helix domain-containing protein [Gilliamella sp. ESL0250]|uniref:helix-turn-helix domain-containing protein n=1 Tax=Gilliamella sp. ESL0250 TaxID=2705036 RepID=UPI001EE9F142|nr:helix-turn-helix domain-containing protein [Gilliamella sp. ESL0250]NUF50507.1 helix-turn-helix domain-containing protein [Gilliamella sp. ESL0250]
MYYTTKEAASYLKEHPTNVRAKASKGIIKGYKRNGKKGHWLFEKEDLDNYIKRNQNDTSQEVLRHNEFEELKKCQSNQLNYTNGAKSGTTRTAHRMVPEEYAKALGLAISKKH